MALSKIGSAGLASGAVEAADIADGAITSAKLANPNVFMGRNRIINGAMVIDQRNAGAAVTASGAYPVDRFVIPTSNDGAYSAQQDSSAPSGFNTSVKVTTTTADASLGATQFIVFRHRIEGFNVADLNWGTANAKTVTLSFWTRSSLTGTFGGALRNSANDRTYPFTYTISVANTWEYKTITVAGDTTGTWLTTNGIGLQIDFGLGVGSTYSGTAGAWAGSLYLSATGATSVIGTLNATWYITGVQLEVGSVATDFERRLYGTELALCQRYYWQIGSAGTSGNYYRFAIGSCTGGAGNDGILQLPVRMRTAPSLTTSGTASHYGAYSGGTVKTCVAEPTLQGNSTWEIIVVDYAASGQTTGYGSQLISNNNQTAYFKLSAEL